MQFTAYGGVCGWLPKDCAFLSQVRDTKEVLLASFHFLPSKEKLKKKKKKLYKRFKVFY